jgi:hypothetical protein
MNIDKEEWRDIKGYEGKYQVSNLGNVKSLQYKRLGKERILIPYISNRGYYTVALSMNSKKAVRTIHRLVAETFVENIEDLPMVNHIDGNKKNNRADNLEWCTQKHNIRHAWENGLTGVKELKSELETYKKANDNLLVKNAELRVELETYKKIAKRLAKEILSIHNPIFNMVTVNNMEILIENARKEVEKDREL